MKINFINNAWGNTQIKYNNYNTISNTQRYDTRYLLLPKDTVSFQKSSDVPPEVRTYLDRRKKELGRSYDMLASYATKKLEGIQNGIPLFDGLSIKQILFLANHLTEVVIKRGCNNVCKHCYAEAVPPPVKAPENFISAISYNDFENLCNGFAELNNRFGFNIFKNSKAEYNTLFHDADSSMITLTNNDGIVFDYADLSKMLHDVTGKLVLFDTAGWNIQDKKTQARMDALVEKILNTNEYNFMEFHISVNPFHPIYALSLKQQDPELAKKYRNIYTNRMANIICTFAPLVNKYNMISDRSMLQFNVRALDNKTRNVKGYRVSDLNSLTDEIQAKVKEKLETKSTFGSQHETDLFLDWLKNQFENVDSGISAAGRNAEIVTDKRSNTYKTTLEATKHTPNEAAQLFENGFLDINGKFYITNWREVFPTDICLNYENSEKTTAKIAPNLRKDMVTRTIM